jgi:hypothetical protein
MVLDLLFCSLASGGLSSQVHDKQEEGLKSIKEFQNKYFHDSLI